MSVEYTPDLRPDAFTAPAKSVGLSASRLQRIALAAIRDAGARGLTTHELAVRVRIHRDTIQPRTSELRKSGFIHDSGGRRRNLSGKLAIVWLATAPERLVVDL